MRLRLSILPALVLLAFLFASCSCDLNPVDSEEEELRPSLTCILFGNLGCRAKCAILCRIYNCKTYDAECYDNLFCDCNETFAPAVLQEIHPAPQEDLPFRKILAIKFLKTPVFVELNEVMHKNPRLKASVTKYLRTTELYGKPVKEDFKNRYRHVPDLLPLLRRLRPRTVSNNDDEISMDEVKEEMRKQEKQPEESSFWGGVTNLWSRDKVPPPNEEFDANCPENIKRVIDLIQKIHKKEDLLKTFINLRDSEERPLYMEVSKYFLINGLQMPNGSQVITPLFNPKIIAAYAETDYIIERLQASLNGSAQSEKLKSMPSGKEDQQKIKGDSSGTSTDDFSTPTKLVAKSDQLPDDNSTDESRSHEDDTLNSYRAAGSKYQEPSTTLGVRQIPNPTTSENKINPNTLPSIEMGEKPVEEQNLEPKVNPKKRIKKWRKKAKIIRPKSESDQEIPAMEKDSNNNSDEESPIDVETSTLHKIENHSLKMPHPETTTNNLIENPTLPPLENNDITPEQPVTRPKKRIKKYRIKNKIAPDQNVCDKSDVEPNVNVTLPSIRELTGLDESVDESRIEEPTADTFSPFIKELPNVNTSEIKESPADELISYTRLPVDAEKPKTPYLIEEGEPDLLLPPELENNLETPSDKPSGTEEPVKPKVRVKKYRKKSNPISEKLNLENNLEIPNESQISSQKVPNIMKDVESNAENTDGIQYQPILLSPLESPEEPEGIGGGNLKPIKERIKKYRVLPLELEDNSETPSDKPSGTEEPVKPKVRVKKYRKKSNPISEKLNLENNLEIPNESQISSQKVPNIMKDVESNAENTDGIQYQPILSSPLESPVEPKGIGGSNLKPIKKRIKKYRKKPKIFNADIDNELLSPQREILTDQTGSAPDIDTSIPKRIRRRRKKIKNIPIEGSNTDSAPLLMEPNDNELSIHRVPEDELPPSLTPDTLGHPTPRQCIKKSRKKPKTNSIQEIQPSNLPSISTEEAVETSHKDKSLEPNPIEKSHITGQISEEPYMPIIANGIDKSPISNNGQVSKNLASLESTSLSREPSDNELNLPGELISEKSAPFITNKKSPMDTDSKDISEEDLDKDGIWQGSDNLGNSSDLPSANEKSIPLITSDEKHVNVDTASISREEHTGEDEVMSRTDDFDSSSDQSSTNEKTIPLTVNDEGPVNEGSANINKEENIGDDEIWPGIDNTDSSSDQSLTKSNPIPLVNSNNKNSMNESNTSSNKDNNNGKDKIWSGISDEDELDQQRNHNDLISPAKNTSSAWDEEEVEERDDEPEPTQPMSMLDNNIPHNLPYNIEQIQSLKNNSIDSTGLDSSTTSENKSQDVSHNNRASSLAIDSKIEEELNDDLESNDFSEFFSLPRTKQTLPQKLDQAMHGRKEKEPNHTNVSKLEPNSSTPSSPTIEPTYESLPLNSNEVKSVLVPSKVLQNKAYDTQSKENKNPNKVIDSYDVEDVSIDSLELSKDENNIVNSEDDQLKDTHPINNKNNEDDNEDVSNSKNIPPNSTIFTSQGEATLKENLDGISNSNDISSSVDEFFNINKDNKKSKPENSHEHENESLLESNEVPNVHYPITTKLNESEGPSPTSTIQPQRKINLIKTTDPPTNPSLTSDNESASKENLESDENNNEAKHIPLDRNTDENDIQATSNNKKASLTNNPFIPKAEAEPGGKQSNISESDNSSLDKFFNIVNKGKQKTSHIDSLEDKKNSSEPSTIDTSNPDLRSTQKEFLKKFTDSSDNDISRDSEDSSPNNFFNINEKPSVTQDLTEQKDTKKLNPIDSTEWSKNLESDEKFETDIPELNITNVTENKSGKEPVQDEVKQKGNYDILETDGDNIPGSDENLSLDKFFKELKKGKQNLPKHKPSEHEIGQEPPNTSNNEALENNITIPIIGVERHQLNDDSNSEQDESKSIQIPSRKSKQFNNISSGEAIQPNSIFIPEDETSLKENSSKIPESDEDMLLDGFFNLAKPVNENPASNVIATSDSDEDEENILEILNKTNSPVEYDKGIVNDSSTTPSKKVVPINLHKIKNELKQKEDSESNSEDSSSGQFFNLPPQKTDNEPIINQANGIPSTPLVEIGQPQETEKAKRIENYDSDELNSEEETPLHHILSQEEETFKPTNIESIQKKTPSWQDFYKVPSQSKNPYSSSRSRKIGNAKQNPFNKNVNNPKQGADIPVTTLPHDNPIFPQEPSHKGIPRTPTIDINKSSDTASRLDFKSLQDDEDVNSNLSLFQHQEPTEAVNNNNAPSLPKWGKPKYLGRTLPESKMMKTPDSQPKSEDLVTDQLYPHSDSETPSHLPLISDHSPAVEDEIRKTDGPKSGSTHDNDGLLNSTDEANNDLSDEDFSSPIISTSKNHKPANCLHQPEIIPSQNKPKSWSNMYNRSHKGPLSKTDDSKLNPTQPSNEIKVPTKDKSKIDISQEETIPNEDVEIPTFNSRPSDSENIQNVDSEENYSSSEDSSSPVLSSFKNYKSTYDNMKHPEKLPGLKKPKSWGHMYKPQKKMLKPTSSKQVELTEQPISPIANVNTDKPYTRDQSIEIKNSAYNVETSPSNIHNTDNSKIPMQLPEHKDSFSKPFSSGNNEDVDVSEPIYPIPKTVPSTSAYARPSAKRKPNPWKQMYTIPDRQPTAKAKSLPIGSMTPDANVTPIETSLSTEINSSNSKHSYDESDELDQNEVDLKHTDIPSSGEIGSNEGAENINDIQNLPESMVRNKNQELVQDRDINEDMSNVPVLPHPANMIENKTCEPTHVASVSKNIKKNPRNWQGLYNISKKKTDSKSDTTNPSINIPNKVQSRLPIPYADNLSTEAPESHNHVNTLTIKNPNPELKPLDRVDDSMSKNQPSRAEMQRNFSTSHNFKANESTDGNPIDVPASSGLQQSQPKSIPNHSSSVSSNVVDIQPTPVIKPIDESNQLETGSSPNLESNSPETLKVVESMKQNLPAVIPINPNGYAEMKEESLPTSNSEEDSLEHFFRLPPVKSEFDLHNASNQKPLPKIIDHLEIQGFDAHPLRNPTSPPVKQETQSLPPYYKSANDIISNSSKSKEQRSLNAEKQTDLNLMEDNVLIDDSLDTSNDQSLHSDPKTRVQPSNSKHMQRPNVWKKVNFPTRLNSRNQVPAKARQTDVGPQTRSH